MVVFGYLHAVLLLELHVLLVQGVDSVNHGLDELDLGVSQSVLVGDVVGVSGLAARLSAGATGLDSELLAPGLELVDALLGPAGKVNVDGGPHAGTQVGGAGVDVAELLGQLEVLAGLSLDAVADSLDATVGGENFNAPDQSYDSFRHNYRARRSKTPLTSPPFCMEMMRV